MRRIGLLLATIIVVAGAGLVSNRGAHLRVALEDKADANPRQMALAAEVAGLCLGFAISWTERVRAHR